MAALQFVLIAVLLGIDSVKDIRTREIPNWISGAIALTAFINFDVRSLWGLIVAFIFFGVALATGKIGGGDVKLVAALSVVCGLVGSLVLLFFAQLTMLIFYAGYYIFCKINGRTAGKSLPFVPFIFIGYLISAILI